MKGIRRTPASKNRAVTIAAASASLLSLSAVPAIVHADNAASSASGVYVTILSPNPGTDLSGKKQIEISAYYESSFGVSSLDLFVDGKRLATKNLASAENRGEISFVVDADAFQSGSHAIVIRATATDQEVASARTTLTLPGVTTAVVTQSVSGDSNTDQTPAAPQTDVAGSPTIEIQSPAKSESVQGLVQIKVNAVDSSGKAPYVSLFIDKSFKTLRNFAPYTFDWDTTKLPNGLHLIEVYGYNDAQKVGHATPVEVMVNNPSGRTFERHDLSDIAPAAGKPAAKIMAKSASRTKVAKLDQKHSSFKPNLSFDFIDSVVPHLISLDRQPARLDLNATRVTASSILDGIDGSSVDLAASNHAAAHATKASVTKAASIVRKASTKNVPHLHAHAAVLSDTNSAIGGSLRSSDQIDNLSAAPLDSTLASAPIGMENAAAPNIVVTRRASASAIPSLVNKAARSNRKIASAKMETSSDAVIGADRIVSPKIDLNAIEQNARVIAPQLSERRVSIKALSIRDMHMLRGAHEVVVDNQRISLGEPLQERGALLYAPMRQIFESQGGQLTWDQATHEVRAVTPVGEVVLKIGSHHAMVNDKAVKMQGSAYLLNNRTMVPVDFYATALNASISFDPHTGHLIIENKS